MLKGGAAIHKVFDLTRKHWVDTFSKLAVRSFDEELKLYELLELDAAEEDDIANDLDEDTADGTSRNDEETARATAL